MWLTDWFWFLTLLTYVLYVKYLISVGIIHFLLDSGSDSASLKTRAVKKDDHYIINGTKVCMPLFVLSLVLWKSCCYFCKFADKRLQNMHLHIVLKGLGPSCRIVVIFIALAMCYCCQSSGVWVSITYSQSWNYCQFRVWYRSQGLLRLML